MGSIILENFDPDKENQPVHREIKSLLIMVLFLFEAGLALPPSPLPKNPSSCSSGILVHFYPNTPFKWPVFLKQNKDALIVNIFKSNKLMIIYKSVHPKCKRYQKRCMQKKW